MTTPATIVELAQSRIGSTMRTLEVVASTLEVMGNLPGSARALRDEIESLERVDRMLDQLVTVEAADAMRPELVRDPETGTLKEKGKA